MNTLRWKLTWLATLFVVAALVTLHAQTDTSDPVGVFRMKLRGNSDTIVSLPLQRAPLLESRIVSRNASVLELAADAPALPAEGAFALVLSGSLEGAALPITARAGRTITLDGAGFDLATLQTEAVNGTVNADLVAVVPYWTLDTLFPQGRGVHASGSPLLIQTQVLMFDDTRAGKNHSAAAIYYYYSGTGLAGPGWYRFGVTNATAGTTAITPHRYVIVRHPSAADTELFLLGGVQMAGFRIPVHTRAANEDQDNLVALPVPVPTSLAATKLVESGAFQPSTSPLLIADQLLVFDNTAVQKNKSASAIYYYYQGTALQGTGWYRLGNTTSRADAVLLPAGEGIVIRKSRTPAPVSKQWTGVPAYLQ